VTGKNDAFSLQLKPVGDAAPQQGPNSWGHYGGIAESGAAGMTPTLSVGAYDPVTGQQVWNSEMAGGPGGTSGNMVTAGDVVFQGTTAGELVALDARTGKQLFTYVAKSRIGGSPLTFQVNGKQYVSAVAGNTIVTLSLP
jgi:outer membrane protein assembly factor BamB